MENVVALLSTLKANASHVRQKGGALETESIPDEDLDLMFAYIPTSGNHTEDSEEVPLTMLPAQFFFRVSDNDDYNMIVIRTPEDHAALVRNLQALAMSVGCVPPPPGTGEEPTQEAWAAEAAAAPASPDQSGQTEEPPSSQGSSGQPIPDASLPSDPVPEPVSPEEVQEAKGIPGSAEGSATRTLRPRRRSQMGVQQGEALGPRFDAAAADRARGAASASGDAVDQSQPKEAMEEEVEEAKSEPAEGAESEPDEMDAQDNTKRGRSDPGTPQRDPKRRGGTKKRKRRPPKKTRRRKSVKKRTKKRRPRRRQTRRKKRRK